MANVQLYYLGGLGQPGRTVTIVRSRGKIYNLPPQGESLELPEFVANDLISRHKIRTKDGVYEAFTKDARIAKKVKEAGDLRAQVVGEAKSMTLSEVLRNFSKEELAAAILEADQAEAEEEPEAEVPPVPTKKVGAKTSKATDKPPARGRKKKTEATPEHLDPFSEEGEQ